MTQQALLLVNLGSPASTEVADVRRYLNQFLMDPYVIDLPWPVRRLLVSLILIKRPAASAHAYQSIWWEEGSPLVVLSRQLCEAIKPHWPQGPVELAMRYGEPSIESSLKRLRTDYIDLYLLHWPGSHPLGETIEAFETLKASGKIRHYGLSNFDADAVAAALGTKSGQKIACNQVLYNLARRGIENRLLPWCAKNDVAVMAYSPLDQGRLTLKPGLKAVAQRHNVTPEAIAIAWTMRQPHLCTIPKATSVDHLRANIAAASLSLSAEDLAALDADYPAPKGHQPLEML